MSKPESNYQLNNNESRYSSFQTNDQRQSQFSGEGRFISPIEQDQYYETKNNSMLQDQVLKNFSDMPNSSARLNNAFKKQDQGMAAIPKAEITEQIDAARNKNQLAQSDAQLKKPPSSQNPESQTHRDSGRRMRVTSYIRRDKTNDSHGSQGSKEHDIALNKYNYRRRSYSKDPTSSIKFDIKIESGASLPQGGQSRENTVTNEQATVQDDLKKSYLTQRDDKLLDARSKIVIDARTSSSQKNSLTDGAQTMKYSRYVRDSIEPS